MSDFISKLDDTQDAMRCIEKALARFPKDDVVEASKHLLSILGYQSERVPPEQSGDVGEFIGTYPAKNPNTKSEQFFRENVKSVNILFQMTDSEIGALTEQGSLFIGDGFEKGNAKSFMFATVQMRGGGGRAFLGVNMQT